MDARELTAARLRQVLNYCPETGVFTWLYKPNRRILIGSIAGSVDENEYILIRVDKLRYFAHRLAWLYMTGEWPVDCIDHIDGDPSNNRWPNLRAATKSLNMENRRRPKATSKSGFLGVTVTPKGRAIAQISAKGCRFSLGSFDTAEEAHAAYVKAKRLLHAGCTI